MSISFVTGVQCFAANVPLLEISEISCDAAGLKYLGENSSAYADIFDNTAFPTMEHAGDGDMPEYAERSGIGTPSTRAGTIEKLVSSSFVERKRKNLIPTDKGSSLYTAGGDNFAYADCRVGTKAQAS